MVAYCSGHYVGTVDTSITALRPPKNEISKKNFLERKSKQSHTAHGTALVPLTSPFHLSDIIK